MQSRMFINPITSYILLKGSVKGELNPSLNVQIERQSY